MAGIDQNQSSIGSGRPSDHISGVLNVSRGISNNELARGGGEVTVGHVNGNPLLAFVFQSVGKQAKINALQAFPLRALLDRFHLVDVHAFRVK